MNQEPQYRPVTGAEIRKYGICKGQHKELGYWKLLCGCIRHATGVSVTRERGQWEWKFENGSEES